MPTFTRRTALLGLLATALAFGQQQQAPAPLRVLFIGNSYTYFNNLPKLVESIAASQKDAPRIVTEAVLRGGERLKGHWTTGKALEAVRKGGWDFVVLQEHSTLGITPGATPGGLIAINDPADYFEYARKFNDEIRKVGARTVLYATWSREHLPEQQRRLDDAIVRLARELDAGIAPVGLAWNLARVEAADVRLYQPDRSHPRAAGSYLAALVFYLCLTGKTSLGDIPAVVTGPEWNTEKQVTLANLSYSDKMTLQIFAQRAVAEEPLRPAIAKK